MSEGEVKVESVGLTVGLAGWRDAVSGLGVRSFISTALNWAWKVISVMYVKMTLGTMLTAVEEGRQTTIISFFNFGQ